MSWKTLDRWEKLATIIGGIILLIGAIYGTWKYFFPKSDLTLTTAMRPGPVIEYDPTRRILQFEFAFNAENRGNRSETLVDVLGSLSADQTDVLYFGAMDFKCRADGAAIDLPYSFSPDTLHHLRCTAAHRFTRDSIVALRDPGPSD